MQALVPDGLRGGINAFLVTIEAARNAGKKTALEMPKFAGGGGKFIRQPSRAAGE